MDFSHLRKDYQGEPIGDEKDPLALLRLWIKEADEAEIVDPSGFVLATASPDGHPSTRTVLLKELLPEGFLFFTNLDSRKAEEIRLNRFVSGVFLYTSLARQILIEGEAAPCSNEKSAAYFATRPRASQIAAWASSQGEEMESRRELEKRFGDLEREFSGKEIPCPPFWGGFIIHLTSIEFWQGMPSRLHDRLRFTRAGEGWQTTRLMP